MYQTRRPAFRTAAMEAAENRALDAKLARQDAERREQLDAAIERDLAARTPERIAQDNAELARLDAKAADESRKHQAWTERNRADRMNSWTSGT
jgi:hypothetical protein